MFLLYNIISTIFLVISPFVIIARMIIGKEDTKRFLEKYSLNIKNKSSETIWFHGASIGELMSILPLIKKFEKDKSIKKILVTSSTISSASIIKKIKFKKTAHVYYPFDVGFICNNFLNKWKPKIAIFVESEIWPNMFEKINTKKIPLILINARITNKSFNRWQISPNFAKYVFSKITIALPQNQETKNYLKRLGVKKINFIGNLKFFKNSKKILKQTSKKILKTEKYFVQPVLIIMRKKSWENYTWS